MPNHCYNRVHVYSDKPEVIKEIHDIFETGTNPYVDKTVFGQIIPEPDWKNTPLAAEDVQEYNWINLEVRVGELPVVKDKGFGEVSILSQLISVMTDGTTGESPTGVLSGIATISALTKMNKN